MKMFLLLYFLMNSGEAVEAFEADAFEDDAITAYHGSGYMQAL
jgi:hypothetical protein